MIFRPEDIRIEVYPDTPRHGMKVGLGSRGVKATHLSTGLSVVSTSERSQHMNRLVALEALSLLVKEFVDNEDSES